MNNAKLWLVVKPTVGIPLFLSAVAIGSFAVHVAVLTNTTWLGNFLKGRPLTASVEQPRNSVASITQSGSEATIVLPDGRTGRIVFDAPRAQAENSAGVLR